jgi:hypothetical protein
MVELKNNVVPLRMNTFRMLGSTDVFQSNTAIAWISIIISGRASSLIPMRALAG